MWGEIIGVIVATVLGFAGWFGVQKAIAFWRKKQDGWQRIALRAQAFESSWDIQCIVDFQSRLRVANMSLSRLLGYSVTELESMRVQQFIHIEDAPATCVEFKRIMSGQVTLHFESRWRAKDGSYKSIEWSGVPDLQNGMVYFTGRDVSHIKEVFSDLEAKKSAAETATKSKSEFLAVMSHEIRTPLNGVLATANLLRDTSLSSEQLEYIDIIRSSGTALLSVINDILDFSRIESKKMKLEMCEFDLAQCVEESIDLCSGPAAEKHLDLALDIDDSVPAVLVGDAARLRQVLTNLGGNGVKFTPNGEVAFRVELASPDLLESLPESTDEDPKSLHHGEPVYVHFSVRDTGIGIPEEGKERLFRSFSQVDSSTTRRFGGSGLGLAICNALCALMGGRIWMESAGHGHGCTFHFVVRLNVPKANSSRNTPPHRSRNMRDRHVLFVDDSAACRTQLSRHANSLGLEGDFAATAIEAVQHFLASRTNDKPYDVIVLDHLMGATNGAELAAQLRELGCVAPIMLMVYKHIRPVHGDRAAFPWQAEVLKPVKFSQLQRALAELSQKQPGSGTSPVHTPPATPKAPTQSRLRILLAEDVEVNQRVASMQIQKLGYAAPDVVSNGQEALDAILRRDYDVILMDVSMPVLDGIEATRRLRLRRPRDEGPFVVALTANVFPQQIASCMECGMDGYVSKPVAIAELQNVLQRAEELAPVFAVTAAASRACSPMIRPRVLERDRLPKRPVSSPPHSVCSTPVYVAEGVKSAPTSSPVPFPKLTAEAPGSRRSSGGSQPPAQENRAVKTSVLEDRQTLDLLKEANVLKDVALLFIDQAESAIKDMQTSAALGDSNRLRFVAHSFCSSAGSVGAKRLCAMVRDVERRAELEHVVPSVEHLLRINEEIRLACSALRAECGDCISVYSPPSERALQATAVVAAHAARPVSLDPIHPLSPDAVFFQRV